MSIGQPLSGITFSGISSGIDVSSIVSQLISLERIPISRLESQKSKMEFQAEIYGQFKSRITSFNSSLSQMNSASAFKPVKASLTDAEVASVTATGSAAVGSYDLKVSKLATAQKLSSAAQASHNTALGLEGEFTINDKSLTIVADQNLADIAAKINDLDADVTASVINGGENQAYLILTSKTTGAANEIELADVSGGAFAALGLNTELIAAQDAEYSLDGISLTSASNKVENVIPGATITLLKADETTPKSTTITIARDNAQVKSSLKSFMSAYNDVVGFIRDYSQFDSDTYSSGPLFADTYAAQVETSLSSLLFNDVGTGDVKNLTQLGFSFDDKGLLKLDEARIDSLLDSNPDAVKNIIAATGSSSNTSLAFVAAGLSTVSSSPTGYEVDITQAATKSLLNAQVVGSDPNAGGEMLTFSGALFGSKTVQIAITTGASLNDVVDQINSHSKLKDVLVASIGSGGELQVESKRYGSSGGFSVVSNMTAASDNSGIGISGSTYSAGLDVAGTINGEAATGNGQFLSGNKDNEFTDGLQIQYTGTTTGVVGSMVFTQGLANILVKGGSVFTDSVDGVLTTADKSLADQVSYINERIAELEEALVSREQYLRIKFAAMEEAIAKLNAQQGQLGAIFGSQSG